MCTLTLAATPPAMKKKQSITVNEGFLDQKLIYCVLKVYYQTADPKIGNGQKLADRPG